MYKARHIKTTKRRMTLPMLVLVAALCVAILIFPTTASGDDGEPDVVAGSRMALAQVSAGDTFSVVPSAQHGGSVTPLASDASVGDTVTFTVSADKGFETASVAAITSSGNTLQVVRVKGETYSFTMPAESVVIDVAFQYTRAA